MKPKTEKPSAAEFGQLRAYLAKNGCTPAQVSVLVGATVQGRTRGQIGDRLRVGLKELPRRVGP